MARDLAKELGVSQGYIDRIFGKEWTFEFVDDDEEGEEEEEDEEDSTDDAKPHPIAEDADRWITVHPNGIEEKGRPMLIEGETGEVKAGLGGKFNGRNIDDIPRGKNPHPVTEEKWQARQQRLAAKKTATSQSVDPASLPQNTQQNSGTTPTGAVAKTQAGITAANALASHPFKPGGTTKDYQGTLKEWLPDSRILLGKIQDSCAEGTANAVHAILSDFPDLASTLRGIGTLTAINADIKEKSKILAQDETSLAQDIDFRLQHGGDAMALWSWAETTGLVSPNLQPDDAAFYLKKMMKLPWTAKNEKECFALPENERKAYIHEHVINSFFEKRAKAKLSVGLGSTKSNAFAMASKTQGVMLTKDFDNDAELKSSWLFNVKAGFHPRGTEANPSKAIVAHELGHQVDFMLTAKNDPVIQNLYIKKNVKKDLSVYGGTSMGEMIAEAFSEVYASPTPRPLSQEIVTRVKELYQQKLSRHGKNILF